MQKGEIAMNIFSSKYYLLITVSYFFVICTSITAFSRPGGALTDSPGKNYLSSELLAAFIQVEGEVAQHEINQHLTELNAFVINMRRKQEKYRSERRFLSYFFYKVHRQFLKRYQSHTTMYELLEEGNYDCVTGSALYALLLDALDIPYRVHEFPYHVYLTATTSNQDTIMIESTDPQYGLVTDADEQAERYRHYSRVTDTEAYYQYDFTIQERIGLTELAGLSYFNEAVEHYNNQEFQQATQLLRQANRWYRSPRTEAFEALISSLSQK